MKTRRLLCAGFICCLTAGLFAIGLPTTVWAAPKADYAKVTKAPKYSYELEEVGSFKADKYDVDFQRSGALEVKGTNDDPEIYLLGPDGKRLLDQKITGLNYLGNGVYAVNIDNGDEINNCGLVNTDGKQLLDFEAAVIKTVTNKAEDGRFAEVVYATKKTDKKEDAFVYSTDDNFSISPDEDDTMYEGYAEVFDLKKGKKVKGVRITNNTYNALHDLGDSFIVEQEDGSKIMYDASGKEIWNSGSSYTNISDHGVVVSEGNTYSIVDSKGKMRYESENSLTSVQGPNGYFMENTGDKEYTVIDMDGNQVLKGSYDYISYEAGGLFDVGQDDDERVVDGNGKTIVEHSAGELVEIVPGYCKSYNKDETVLLEAGKEVLKGDSSSVKYMVVKNDDDKYFVFEDGDYSLELSYISAYGTALVCGKEDSSSSEYGLYDLFTGKTLLDQKYEKVGMAGGYIYAYADGTWTTYEVELDD